MAVVKEEYVVKEELPSMPLRSDSPDYLTYYYYYHGYGELAPGLY